MAELQGADEIHFREQQVEYVDELKRPILAYFLSVGKITQAQRYSARITPDKNGFVVETNCCSSGLSVTSPDLFNNENLCKNGRINLKSNHQNLYNMNNSNSATYQQDSVNHALSATSNCISISHQSQFDDEPQYNSACDSRTTNLPHNAIAQLSDAAVSPETLGLPNPSLPVKCTYPYELTYNCDKSLKLLIKKIKKNKLATIDGCTISSVPVSTRGGTRYEVTIECKISMGAQTEPTDAIVIRQEHDNSLKLHKCEMNVLKINSFECYKAELYVRGQMGPSEDLDAASRLNRKNRIKVDTFIRYISFFGFIFEVDFYDYYIYRIVGKVCDNAGSLSYQWPWHNEDGMPTDSPFNTDNIVNYEDLSDGIDIVGEFFNIFSNETRGWFCNSIPGLINKRVMQLCLALGYSEAIRNFQAIEWNSLLLNEILNFRSVDDLKEAIRLHPMVTRGSFQKRKTGFSGGTVAAKNRVQPFKEFLNKFRKIF